MSSRKPFTQVNFCATLLRGAAVVLFISASAAHSETLDLACSTPEHDYNPRIQIDTGNKTATVSPDGSHYSVTEVTDQLIKFENLHAPGIYLKGVVDRIAGTAVLTEESDKQFIFRTTYLVCRRATLKF